MSELLPNLPSLIAALPIGAKGTDARELTSAVESAQNEDELNAAISSIVTGWLGK